ncbi:nucleotidyltransferase domain-containing protein [Flavobacterium ardleyense]|uniref:Nucleotidyltransferase domain-containing protein n=1 Tax=Flavobacterium ardleyense TaxID=2038737 RepID=A0ABW5ZA70_9FLAO
MNKTTNTLDNFMGKLDIKEKLINTFLKENFKNEANILLFGSNIEGYNENSDIDILIISSHFNAFTKETYYFKNQSFDVMIVPLYEINAYLEKDKFIKVYIDIFTKGRVISDKDGVLKKIISQIKKAVISENKFLWKNQIEKNISFFIGKMSKSKNIYEAEIYFNKVSENIYTRRLLDFGICNIDSSKHLVNKIIDLDLSLVEKLYKLKKKLMQLQNVSIIINELEKILNLNNIWYKNYYSNNLVLSKIYEDRMIIFVENNSKIINKIERFLRNKSINYYCFSIDKYNINNEGNYYVILEKKEILRDLLIPQLRETFFNDDDIIENDSKIIFPYQMDMKTHIGVSDNNIFIELEKLFLLINAIKKENGIVFYIFFDVLKKLNSNVVIENLIYIFAGKSILLNNTGNLDKSLSFLIELKNKYYNKKISISSKEVILYKKSIENTNDIIPKEFENLKNQLNKVSCLISKEDVSIIYGVTNSIFNIFEIKDYQKPYIITIVKKILNNES